MMILLCRVLTILLLCMSSAYACSCITRIPLEQHFRAVKSVLVGQVIATKYVAAASPLDDYVEVTVAVRELLKGWPQTTITVKDQISVPGTCSAWLSAGVEYVLFIEQDDTVSRCNGTRPFMASIYDRQQHLKELYALKARALRGLNFDAQSGLVR